MRNSKKALIVNFSGLGNGLIILPILKCIENSEPSLKYYHVWNPILATQDFLEAAALQNLNGLVPSNWRRFSKSDWENIYTFINQHDINIVINMRNEGPEFDLDYFEFKNSASSKLTFWDLNFPDIQSRKTHRLLAMDILAMLEKQGINIDNYDPHWLARHFMASGNHKMMGEKIGFYTGASQINKRWTLSNWMELGDLFLSTTDCVIEIYSGLSDEEIQLAKKIVFELQSRYSVKRCSIVIGLDIFELAGRIYTLDLLISNDTFAIHLGAALHIPTVGLYFSTDASIWGGNSSSFFSVQSQIVFHCPMIKSAAGNCRLYYEECLGECRSQFDCSTSRVWQSVRNMDCVRLRI